MRIVLDTNIVISALLWQGAPHQLLGGIRTHADWQICSSLALLDELADVLARPFAARRLAQIGLQARDLLSDYVECTEWGVPHAVPRVIAADADDDQVLAAALAARADLIVSGDKQHLLPLGSYQGIAIVDAAEALRRLKL
ncbi:MAG: putative toxin-antitoxin system toxin component, PIN family [Curvibacter lanceolatus]|uniref:putative toxin-antitoxin system toxin component, PIN family n=1 Tax=Curvibacter lanceolatus TaxID=86182 RepID=UPI00036A480F|nr:putative toxin-antitoxin system toxin component, PIN family [Curvibacter lanceolatus]MBV5294172.1 putative toxin-antitoxin system toxin component, PIN family [Curvibacter lanceolatus]